jgi:hypothetical protein
MRWRFFILYFFIFIQSLEIHAQQRGVNRDSLLILQPGMDTTAFINEIDTLLIDTDDENRPVKAALYAAILPGLGQIYNKKYWKLPVLYGGMATMGYFIDYNNKKYQQYRNAFLEKRSLPEELWTDPLAINVTEDNLQRGIDYYRRNRDLLMILLGGVYFLQIVDAHVDAHLMEFDISEDLSFRIEPGFQPDGYTASINYGLKFIISFN